MISSGENLGWVQKMMGHSSLKMITDKYFSYIPNMTHNDGARVLEEFGRIGGKKLTQMCPMMKKGRLGFGNLLESLLTDHFYWWRRGESNPRPKVIRLSIYIHSPVIGYSPPGSLPGEVTKGLTWLSFASPMFRSIGSATLLSGVLINPAGVDQKGRWPLSGHGVRIIVCVCV